MAQYYAIITDIGNAQIANAIALGKTISLTHMAVGDANGNQILPIPTQKSLVHETYRAQINSLTIDEENPNVVICEFIIPEDVGGFYVRELGVFDNEGNLIAVGNTPESYKPKMTEGSGAQKVMRMHLVTSASDKIELKINPSIVVATIDLVNKKVDELKKSIENKSEKNHVHEIVNINGLESALAGKAALNSPAFTGTPQAPTQLANDNSTKLATTAFVQNAVSSLPKVDLTGYLKITDADNKYAFKSITVNGQPLSKNVNLLASDVNAFNKTESDARYALSARKINAKQLTADINLTAADVGAAAINGSNIDVPSYLQKLGLKEVSLSTNGWSKLASGLIIQCVRFRTSGYNNFGTPQYVDLPIMFPNALFFAVGSEDGGNSGAIEVISIDLNRTEKGRIAIYSNYVGEGLILAIGY